MAQRVGLAGHQAALPRCAIETVAIYASKMGKVLTIVK